MHAKAANVLSHHMDLTGKASAKVIVIDTRIFSTIMYKLYLIQMKCQGGNKYALSITVKFDQSTRKFGRISFARLFKFTKHIALLFYFLSPYLLS